MRRAALVSIVACGAMILSSCKFGVTKPATAVHDTSATLNGRAYSEETGTVRWWFEYGATPALGLSTPEQQFENNYAKNSRAVTANINGLSDGTLYHYRACAAEMAGPTKCGTTYTFTTTTGRDSVSGFGVVSEMPQLGYYDGASLDVSGDADGVSPEGTISVSPGSAYFRIPDEGPITCLRVSGNQAVVGFLADATDYDPEIPLVPRLTFIEDNGATGDRVRTTTLTEPATTCPEPASADPGGGVIIRGDFVIHDHPDT